MLTWLIQRLQNTMDHWSWKFCSFLKTILMWALKENWLFAPRIYNLLCFLIGKLYFQRIFALLWSTTFRGDNSIFVDIRHCYKKGFIACNVISLSLFGYNIYDCRGIFKIYNSFRVVRVHRRRVVGLSCRMARAYCILDRNLP